MKRRIIEIITNVLETANFIITNIREPYGFCILDIEHIETTESKSVLLDLKEDLTEPEVSQEVLARMTQQLKVLQSHGECLPDDILVCSEKDCLIVHTKYLKNQDGDVQENSIEGVLTLVSIKDTEAIVRGITKDSPKPQSQPQRITNNQDYFKKVIEHFKYRVLDLDNTLTSAVKKEIIKSLILNNKDTYLHPKKTSTLIVTNVTTKELYEVPISIKDYEEFISNYDFNYNAVEKKEVRETLEVLLYGTSTEETPPTVTESEEDLTEDTKGREIKLSKQDIVPVSGTIEQDNAPSKLGVSKEEEVTEDMQVIEETMQELEEDTYITRDANTITILPNQDKTAVESVLEKYKERLVDISSKNKLLLFRGVTNKKQAYDLASIANPSERDKFLNWLLKRGNEDLTLDKFSFIQDSKTVDSTNEALVNLDKAENDFQTAKDSLSAIKKNALDYEKETGKTISYIGYPYIEGAFDDGTHYRAPLFLFPVTSDGTATKLKISHLEDMPIIVNRVVFLAFTKYNNQKIALENYELDLLEEIKVSNITSLMDFLARIGVSSRYRETGLEEIPKYLKRNANYKRGTNTIKEYAVLGLFDIATSIYTDYKKLEERGLGRGIELLLGVTKPEPVNVLSDSYINTEVPYKENELALITDLDNSQELAVFRTTKSDNLVVYGPPGTGKSQVIANIISNSLSRGKRVLMVSQKKSALDVVYNRLGELNSNAVLLTNAEKGKKDFYNAVRITFENLLESMKTYKTSKIDIVGVSTTIEDNLKNLNTLYETLTRETSTGLTLSEMYKISKPITREDKEDFELLLDYANNPNLTVIKRATYRDLEEAIRKITDIDIIKAYNSQRESRKEFPFLVFFQDKTRFVIYDIQKSINSMVDSMNALVTLGKIVTEDYGYSGTIEDYDSTPSYRNNLISKQIDLVYSSDMKRIEGLKKYGKHKNHLERLESELTLLKGYNLIKNPNRENSEQLSRIGEIVLKELGREYDYNLVTHELYEDVLNCLDPSTFSLNRDKIKTIVKARVETENQEVLEEVSTLMILVEETSKFSIDKPFFYKTAIIEKALKETESKSGYCYTLDYKEDKIYSLVDMAFNPILEKVDTLKLKSLISEKVQVEYTQFYDELQKLKKDLDSVKTYRINKTDDLNTLLISDIQRKTELELGYTYDNTINNSVFYMDILNTYNHVLKSFEEPKIASLIESHIQKEHKSLLIEIEELNKFSLKNLIFGAKTKEELRLKNQELENYRATYTAECIKITEILEKNREFETVLDKNLSTLELTLSENIENISSKLSSIETTYMDICNKTIETITENQTFKKAFEDEKQLRIEEVKNTIKEKQDFLNNQVLGYLQECTTLSEKINQNKEFEGVFNSNLNRTIEQLEKEWKEETNYLRGVKEEYSLTDINLTSKEVEIIFSTESDNLKNSIETLRDTFSKFFDEIDSFEVKRQKLKELTSTNFLKCIDDILTEEGYEDKITRLNTILEDITPLLADMCLVSGLSQLQRTLLRYANSLTDGEDKSVLETIMRLKNVYLVYHIELLESQYGSNLDLTKQYDKMVEKVVSNKNSKTTQVKTEIQRNIIDNLGRYLTRYSTETTEFARQIKKSRGLAPVRKFTETYWDLLNTLFPVWLVTPDVASQVLPLTEDLFDLVIFDEASQMYVESALPSIYRGKSIVIAGDDKQLKPTNVFSGRFDSVGDEAEDEEELTAALEEKSLLDLAKVNYDEVHLMYHYRSKYAELINFSNYAFYNGRLKLAPNVIKQGEGVAPIERVLVNGTWHKGKNELEAKTVVELIVKLLKTRQNKETIGIVTFNSTQKDLIENMLSEKAVKDQQFSSLLTAENNRIENNEDVSLFVKNIENVQGDERDIIIFSTGYAPDPFGKFRANFGTLNQDGGENRLNVAVSRAKQKVYVITSIEPEILNVDKAKNNGAKLLKTYLQYVRAVSDGNSKLVEEILLTLNPLGIDLVQRNQFDSPFEEDVYNALVDHGYEVETQVGVMGYRIDLAVYDRVNGVYLAGIECDGATYHSSKSARERDINRQRFLESRGWNILRIWSRDWWRSSKQELQRIIQELEKLRNANQNSIPLALDLDIEEVTSKATTDHIDSLVAENPDMTGLKGYALDELTQDSLKGKTLKYIGIDSTKYQITSWGNALLFALQYLAKQGVSEEDLDNLDGSTDNTSGWIRKSDEGMRSAKHLGYVDLYVDTHGSAWANYRRVKNTLEKSEIEAVLYLSN